MGARGTRRLALAVVCAAALGCGGRGPLGAQTAPGAAPELSRIEAMADGGRLEAAREALEEWFEAEGETASRREMARARFLRARLTRDADSAEVEYLWVAIDGGAPYGAAAWLRLAQLHVARGEAARARQELERLRAEYPGSELLPESWFWTGRALEALGNLDGACEAWRRAARGASRLVGAGSDLAERAEAARGACERTGLRYAVQLGAFRSRDGAEELRRRAEAEGFEARLERGEELHKVRVGRFASIESAREMADRLRRAGFSAVIVSGGD